MQAIITRYFGPTECRGSRIKATADVGSVTVPYDHALNADGNHASAAKALCARYGWHGTLVEGGMPGNKGRVFVFRGTHAPEIKV